MSSPKLLNRLFTRVFPKTPDFFALLEEQSAMVAHSVELLVRYMECGDPEVGELVKADEHAADHIKVRNLRTLNESFSTPIDREDIFRAIQNLDQIVDYCKSTVNEMDLLKVTPDHYTLEMAQQLRDGAQALHQGFSTLRQHPPAAEEGAHKARKAERNVEKLYRQALADLFQGGDYLKMFKHRELYRHLSNAADRVAGAANTLHDIVVKIS
jgi:hypothetical protein